MRPGRFTLRRLRPPLLAASLAVLGGCSTSQLLYRNADWLVDRWVDGLLELDGPQRAAWRPALERALEGHRESELPEVVGFLEALAGRAAEGLSEPVLACLTDRAEAIYRRHARLAAGLAAPLLAGLSPGQIEGLERRLAERNRDYREEYLEGGPQRRTARRAERVVDRIEGWTGPLRPEQRSLVAEAVGAMPDLAEPWLRYREGRQGALLALLRGGGGAAAVRALLEGWWIGLEGAPEGLAREVGDLRPAVVRLLGDLDGTLDGRQRKALVARIEGVREGLEAVLASEGLDPAPSPVEGVCASVARGCGGGCPEPRVGVR
jgi:hypothetical protein